MLFQSSVTLDDVFSFLVDFRADESLCRSTLLWKQVTFQYSSRLNKPHTLKNSSIVFTFSSGSDSCVLGCRRMMADSSPGPQVAAAATLQQRKKQCRVMLKKRYSTFCQSNQAQVSKPVKKCSYVYIYTNIWNKRPIRLKILHVNMSIRRF